MSEAEQQIHSWQQCRNKREELDLLSNKWDNENCHHKNDIDQDHLTDKGPERLSCCTSINLQRLFPSCQVGIKELQKAIHSGKSSLSQGYSEFGSSQRRLNELSLIQRLLSECVANHHANSQVHPFLRCPYRYEEGFIWWLIRYWQGSTKNWPTGQKSGRRSPPGWNGNHRHSEPEARGWVTIKLSEKTGFTLIPVGAEDEEWAKEETSSKGVEPLDKQPSNILLISPVLAHWGGAGWGEWSTTQSQNLEKWLKCL